MAKLQADLCIDRRRVYAAGSSYGAMFTLAIAQMQPSLLFAAHVSVSGGLLKGFHMPLTPTATSAIAGANASGFEPPTRPSPPHPQERSVVLSLSLSSEEWSSG
jgi:poly(3-hydroxybutyrate) depolymerase